MKNIKWIILFVLLLSYMVIFFNYYSNSSTNVELSEKPPKPRKEILQNSTKVQILQSQKEQSITDKLISSAAQEFSKNPRVNSEIAKILLKQKQTIKDFKLIKPGNANQPILCGQKVALKSEINQELVDLNSKYLSAMTQLNNGSVIQINKNLGSLLRHDLVTMSDNNIPKDAFLNLLYENPFFVGNSLECNQAVELSYQTLMTNGRYGEVKNVKISLGDKNPNITMSLIKAAMSAFKTQGVFLISSKYFSEHNLEGKKIRDLDANFEVIKLQSFEIK